MPKVKEVAMRYLEWKKQEHEEILQIRNDIRIHKYFVGDMKPADEEIIRKLKGETRWNAWLAEKQWFVMTI